MASEPLPPTHVDFTDGFVLSDESLMTIDDDGTRWTETVIGHVDLAAAQTALDAASIDIKATAVRHTWIQINRHKAGCDLDQDELQSDFGELIDLETSHGRGFTVAEAESARRDVRGYVCSCAHDAESYHGIDWWTQRI